MRRLWALTAAVAAVAGAAGASESCTVVGVAGPDRVVVDYAGLPVDLPLAYVEAPSDASAREACQKQLASLVGSQRVTVSWRKGFGTDTDGAARVRMTVGGKDVSTELVAGGFARYSPGASGSAERDVEDPIKSAEAKAKDAHQGIWGEPASAPAAEPSSTASAPAAPAGPTAAAGGPPGPFCSEIDSTYYYPSGDATVANVNPQRLIFYPDEDAAKRAGKQPSPGHGVAVPASDGSEASADAIYDQGKDIYARAIDAGNTPERDQLYAQAFVVLTKAMQVYSALCEKRPTDDALGEKLRRCMQLRYGSVKQRRFE